MLQEINDEAFLNTYDLESYVRVIFLFLCNINTLTVLEKLRILYLMYVIHSNNAHDRNKTFKIKAICGIPSCEVLHQVKSKLNST